MCHTVRSGFATAWHFSAQSAILGTEPVWSDSGVWSTDDDRDERRRRRRQVCRLEQYRNLGKIIQNVTVIAIYIHICIRAA